MSPRRRQLRRVAALDLVVAVVLAALPWVILAFFVFACDLGPRARGDDSRREVHTDAPEFRGTRANAPIPAAMHQRNRGGSDGAGLCVISSLRANGRYQGVPDELLLAMWERACNAPGGYSPDKLRALLDQVMPEEKWASYVGTDPAVLDRLSALGYPIGATMNTGELYGMKPIHHMISLVHYDSARDVACVVDNNQPGVYSWMTTREYRRRWIDGGIGWAFVWTRKAAVVASAALSGLAFALILGGAALAGIAVRRHVEGVRELPAADLYFPGESPDE